MECNFKGINCRPCTIECEEKATDGLAPETIANEINQLHNTTKINENQIPKDILAEFIVLSDKLREHYVLYGLCDIAIFGDEEIRLSEKNFLATFDSYVLEAGYYDHYDRLSSGYNGVTFYAMRRRD